MPDCPHYLKSFVKNQRLNYHLNIAKNKCTEKNIVVTYGQKKFLCNLCPKTFTRLFYLKRHKSTCHNMDQIKEHFETSVNLMKQQTEKTDALIEQLTLQNKLLQEKLLEQSKSPKIINITDNSVNNDNSTNNYYLNSYWNENLDYIDHKTWNEYIDDPHTGIPRLIKAVHFNMDHPENHNIISKNTKEKTFDVFQKHGFEHTEHNDLVITLVSDNALRIENYAASHTDIYDEKRQAALEEVNDEICDETKMILNSKSKPKKNTTTVKTLNRIDKIFRDTHGVIKRDKKLTPIAMSKSNPQDTTKVI
jgi:hypothetical protein